MRLKSGTNILKNFFFFCGIFLTPVSYGTNDSLGVNKSLKDNLPAGLEKFYEDLKKLNEERDKSFSSSTDLIEAVKKNDFNYAEYLIDIKKVDIDELSSFGVTPLITAIIDQNIDMLRFLIRKGADIYKEDIMGQSAMDLSTSSEIDKILIDKQLEDIAQEVSQEMKAQRSQQSSAQNWIKKCLNLFSLPAK